MSEGIATDQHRPTETFAQEVLGVHLASKGRFLTPKQANTQHRLLPSEAFERVIGRAHTDIPPTIPLIQPEIWISLRHTGRMGSGKVLNWSLTKSPLDVSRPAIILEKRKRP